MDKIISLFGGIMKTGTTQKTKSVSKATKQKQRLMILGGGAIVLLALVILLVALVFSSCGSDYAKADTCTVYVLEDGKIVSTDIEAFDEKKYEKKELESYVKDVIDTYNAENEKDSLKKKSLKVKDDVATLVLEYASDEVYKNVNGIDFFTGTVKEAQEAGYKFDVEFAKMSDGTAFLAGLEDFEKDDTYKVVIIKSNKKVVVPGEVCFVSTQNVEKVGDDYVVIKSGSQLLATEIDTEFGTESIGSDESISEDELISGDEDIIFDFGDDAEDENQYTEVLTYIIYK